MADQPPLADADLTRLRAGLPVPLQQWQAAHAPRVLEYARAWRQTGETAFYGKAVGGLRTFVENYQKDYIGGYAIVGFGDGARTAFPLRAGAQDDPAGGGILTAVSPWQEKAVTRGAGDTDTVEWYADWLKVRDDSGEYTPGVDYAHSGDDWNNQLRWLPGGRRPAPGAAYTVRYSSRFGAVARLRVVDGTITFPAAPAADATVYALYVYSPPGGLPYQETTGGDGGFNLVYVDDSFAVKFLDDVVGALEIVAPDPRFPADLKAAYAGLLPRWFDFVTDHGYMRDTLQSNYGVGGEAFRQAAAFYLNDTTRIAACRDFWRAHQAELSGPAPSYAGGFWAEGWNYGNLSFRKLVKMARRWEAAGEDVSAFRAWAADVARYLAHASPGTAYRTIAALGDWFATPPLPTPFPKEVADTLADLGTPVPADRSGLPTDYAATGTGVYPSRSDWSADGMLVTVACGPLCRPDHQQYTPGHVQVEAGETPLVKNGPVLLGDQSGAPKSKLGNCVLIDGGQWQAPGMGYWYDGRTFVKSYQPGPDRTVWRLEPGAAFNRDGAGPCQSWGRDVAFLKGQKAVVVYDRVTVRGDYPWRVQWCADPANVQALSPDGPVTLIADGPFVRLSVPATRQGRIVSVLSAAPVAASLDGFTLTVGGESVALDPDWPADLPDVPAPAPTPDPGPSPVPTLPDWQGKYGALAHALPFGTDNTPGFLATTAQPYRWPVGATWFGQPKVEAQATLAAPADLTVYLLDDGTQRAELLEVVGPDGAALLSESVAGFGPPGVFRTVRVPAGTTAVRATRTAGANAVLGGVFADPVPAPPPPPPAPAPAWAEVGRAVVFEQGGVRVETVVSREVAA